MNGLSSRAIEALCVLATRHNHGQTVYEVTAMPGQGVFVRLSSWPRLQEAQRLLSRLGFASREVETAAHGALLLVTGWDKAALSSRVEQLTRLVNDLEHGNEALAAAALETFLKLREHPGMDEGAARQAAVCKLAVDQNELMREEVGELLHVDLCDLPGDLEAAGLLTQVWVLEESYATLTKDTGRIADDTIGQFIEYRDVHDHDEAFARLSAVLEVAEGTRAVRTETEFEATTRARIPFLTPLADLRGGDRIVGTRGPDGRDDLFSHGMVLTLRSQPEHLLSGNWRLTPSQWQPPQAVLGTLYVPEGSLAWRLP